MAMSAVITFPTLRARPPGETDRTGQAEIVIFPGVRIERVTRDIADRPTAGRRAAPANARPLDRDIY